MLSKLNLLLLCSRLTVIHVVFLSTMCLWPSELLAQAGPAYTMDLVEKLIGGKVNPERVWKGDLSSAGLAFEMNAETEARLRQVGAGDEWIEVLRRATFNPPTEAPANRAAIQERPSFPRRQLRPLYFGNEGRITPYVSVMQLQETGGAVNGYRMQTARGAVRLSNTPLAQMARTYGFVADYASVGLDFEGAFQHDLMMLNVGVKYSPFLPLGASGFRALIGVKPFLGVTRQVLAHLPKQSSDEQEPVVDLLNNIYGGDLSAGLAYHWRPGNWVFAEVNYRMTSTYSRELRAPDQEDITEGIPWSKWAAKGLMFRMGVGF